MHIPSTHFLVLCPRSLPVCVMGTLFLIAWGDTLATPSYGQTASTVDRPLAEAAKGMGGQDDTSDVEAGPASKKGLLIDLPKVLGRRGARDLESLLERIQVSGESRRNTERITVVLRWSSDPDQATEFEDALRFARLVSSDRFRQLRLVGWVDGAVAGHAVLPLLAMELTLVSPSGTIEASVFGDVDPAVSATYQAIAVSRGRVSPGLVQALVDESTEASLVTTTEGQTSVLSGAELKSKRDAGEIVEENVLATPGQPLKLTSQQIRSLGWATAVTASPQDVADFLDLAALESQSFDGQKEWNARLLRVTGPITSDRVRRWQSNLAATTESSNVNAWMVTLDSPGGDLSQSVALAAVLAEPGATIGRVGGFVDGTVRGDAALIALATKPLRLHPESVIGGPGADAIGVEDVNQQAELIELIAKATGRSEGLIRGLLLPDEEVYRFEHVRTGRIRYARPDDVRADDDAEAWERQEQIELAEGLSASRAIELGLAEGESGNTSLAATAIGFNGVPEELGDRRLVRWVERLGRNEGLAMTLLIVGFMLLTTEASAPGLGIPGFFAMLCFAFFFWAKFLAGTAEWLELLAFGLGIACLAIEVFILPGFGVFGVGGLALTILGVVLMSQTFVIPRNPYQLTVLTRSVWIALGGFTGIGFGLIAARLFLPRAALASGLAMSEPEPEIEQSERLAVFDDLLHLTGQTTTPLRPAGKARFGEKLVAVVSDGSAIDAGQAVRVIEVLGNRVTVEAVDS